MRKPDLLYLTYLGLAILFEHNLTLDWKLMRCISSEDTILLVARVLTVDSMCRLQYLSSTPVEIADVRSIIFIVRTKIENAQLVIQQVKHSIW